MFFLILVLLAVPLAQGQPNSAFRLIKSQSGPSGKVIGTKFQLDEVRNRFVFPQDKELMVYFEWDGPPGDHILTGIWKGPDGRTMSLSSDIKMQTLARDFGAYWIYEIAPGMPSGVWTLEVRVDGQPAGSHSFELVVPEVTVQKAPATEPVRAASVDDIYRATKASIVWVHRLDAGGRRMDTGCGFVIGPDRVATAFQNIDAASSLEVEFDDGRRVTTSDVWAYNRPQDWAVVKAATNRIPALTRGDPGKAPVGERLLVYNVEPGSSRVIGGVDFGGRKQAQDSGERLQISPPLTSEAAGGPLLDLRGQVIGVVGGSTKPGGRVGGRALNLSPSLFRALSSVNAATPISLVVQPQPTVAVQLSELVRAGVLTAEIQPLASVTYGGTASAMPANARFAMPTDTSDFSRKDHAVHVYTMWQRKDKSSKGVLSGKVYDGANRVRIDVAGKKINIPDLPMLVSFNFSPASLEPGTYRVDVLFDGTAVWRTFFNVVD